MPSSLIGRAAERAFILSLLDRCSSQAAMKLMWFLLESEAGLGKSAFIFDVLQEVERRGVEFFFGSVI